MKISEVISYIKSLHYGYHGSQKIDDETSRDQILYGDSSQECTGIVTTCFASCSVIEKAAANGSNLIIVHEALFWNRGDKTDWLQDNKVFQAKKKLLDKTGIVVWRDHDYIHSGINIDGQWCDGIFYGLMKQLKWEKYLIGDIKKPLLYEIEETDVSNLAKELIGKMKLNGIRVIGRKEGKVRKVFIGEHIMGRGDNEKLTMIEQDDVDVILTLEMTDYTVSEYIRDGAQFGFQKTIFMTGHFNTEEPGMAYLAEYLKPYLDNLPITFIQSGDAYDYIMA